jgi:uncharacterized protein YkwD
MKLSDPAEIAPARRPSAEGRWRPALPWTLACTLVLATSACGGGGSSGAAPADAPAQPVTQTIAGEAVLPTGEANCGQSTMQADAVARLTQLRALTRSCGSHGTFPAAPAVHWNALLYEAAQRHSVDMANLSYFEHDGPAGDTVSSRVLDTGYVYRSVAENIARGRAGPGGGPLDVAGSMTLWTRSDPHCANLMTARLVEIGLACIPNRSGVRYWTLVLAAPGA